MVFISITRLRVRSLRFMPQFVVHTLRSMRQAKRAGGYFGGALLADRRLTFWTMTLWRDQEEMRRYMTSGAHLRTMPKLLDWCDEASVVHWVQDGLTAPDWLEAARRMRADGRASKVRHPSPDHRELTFPAPRTTRFLAIDPVRPA
ncbi:DUF3291 domain-containing protein [Hansschlegelia beijingensis]|uniref:DUF3291 domain-containing protein n=1 Tax=Hansschlegelia beijingensis TaxID=1133344 RepID=UPI003811FA7F